MAARAPQLADGADTAYLAPVVTVVENPDRDGARWLAALALLIEAGRTVENEGSGTSGRWCTREAAVGGSGGSLGFSLAPRRARRLMEELDAKIEQRQAGPLVIARFGPR